MPWWSLWSQSPTQGTSPSSDAISSTSAASTTRTAPPKANIPSPISRPVSQTARIQKSLPTEEPRDDLINSSDIWEIGAKSLQTGAIAGSIGAFVGGGAGIMRSAPPVLFAAFAGFQWFSLGFSYRASKSIISHAWGGEENFSDSDRVKASGVGGAVAGMVGGMIRGPRNIIPGVLVFSTLASAGTYASQKFRTVEDKQPKKSIWDHKWSPLTKLTEEQYIEKLEERILRIDAEIAIIDDTLAPLKKSLEAEGKSPESKK